MSQLREHRESSQMVARLLSRPLPECLVALRHTGWDENRAVQWLLDKAEGIGRGSPFYRELKAFRAAVRQDQLHPPREDAVRRHRPEAVRLMEFFGRTEVDAVVALDNNAGSVER